MTSYQFLRWLETQHYPCRTSEESEVFAHELSLSHYSEWLFQNAVIDEFLADAIAQGLIASTKVKRLSFADCELPDENCVEKILDSVHNHLSLSSVSFNKVRWPDSCPMLLAECIIESPNLESVTIHNTPINSEGKQAISTAVASVSNFIFVDFKNNDSTDPAAAEDGSSGAGALFPPIPAQSESPRPLYTASDDLQRQQPQMVEDAAPSCSRRRRGYTFKGHGGGRPAAPASSDNPSPVPTVPVQKLGLVSYRGKQAEILEDGRLRLRPLSDQDEEPYFSTPPEFVRFVDGLLDSPLSAFSRDAIGNSAFSGSD